MVIILIGTMHPQITCQSSTKLTYSKAFMIYFYAILSALKEEIFLKNKINWKGEIITNNDGTNDHFITISGGF
jgi:hypothetical protein